MLATDSELVRTWFLEVWTKGRMDATDQYATPDWVAHGIDFPDIPHLSHREKFKIVYQAYRTAFPDISITVDRTVADSELVAAHCTVRATHTGEGLGVAPTGRTIHFTGIIMARCADGKIVESWDSWNFLTMHRQLGLPLSMGAE